MKRTAIKLAVSVIVSVFVLVLLAWLVSHGGGEISADKIITCVQQAILPLVAVYALCQLAQTLLRAMRSRVLLRAGMQEDRKELVPGIGHITLVSFVRGACADMLPVRVGELSYVAMLNRGYEIPVSDCLSSLFIGLLFDFAALLIVLAVAVSTISQGLSLLGSAMLLFVVCVVGWIGLFLIMPWFTNLLQRHSPQRLKSFCFYRRAVKMLDDLSTAVQFVRKSGSILQVLGLSAAIRCVKYFGLYFLFLAVTRRLWPDLASASVPAVLVALICAEGAASMPLPSFMSFGSYEAGGLVALTSLGFGMAESMTAMLSMHLISQTIDYSLGGIAFGFFTWMPRKPIQHVAATGRERRLLLSLSAASIAAVVWALILASGGKNQGVRDSAEASPIGHEVSLSDAEQSVLLRSGFKGKIVWSSNRYGSHDLLMVEYPSGKIRRLTSSMFADTFPRFSPDGRCIAFSRSKLPWVSQRDPYKWDTYILDLQSGRETLVATNAFMASWAPDGESLVYGRGDRKMVRKRAIPGAPEEVILESGRGKVPAGFELAQPSIGGIDSIAAATIRGSLYGTGVFDKDGSFRQFGSGCQITWQSVDSANVIWMDHPGKQKNAIYTADIRTGVCRVLLDRETEYSHEYFPRTSPDGRWLVFGASTGGHEHDMADYEIFLWRIGTPQSDVCRITSHTGNDCWPDIVVAGESH